MLWLGFIKVTKVLEETTLHETESSIIDTAGKMERCYWQLYSIRMIALFTQILLKILRYTPYW